MRVIVTSMLIVVALVAIASAHSHSDYQRSSHDCTVWTDRDLNVDFDDDVLVMDFKDDDIIVEITPDYRLYVDGERVELNDEQQTLVKEFYDQAAELVVEAGRIGIEGAKIGVHGAKIGLQSVAGLLRVLFTDYETDDLERDLEREASKIEAKADKLEEKAEKLEKIADGFEKKWSVMCHKIPALADLD